MSYEGPHPIPPHSGGTGVVNIDSSTITLGAAFSTTPGNAITLTTTGTTNVTLPTSGTLATTSQLTPTPVSLANGGTNASLTASNGGIFYSTASAGAILSGTATASQVLLSGSSTTPAWSTATYPATTTANQILYSSANNTIAGLATANNSVLITSSGGVPSLSTTLPTAVQNNITTIGVNKVINTYTVSSLGQTMAVGNGYASTNGSLITSSLPTTAAAGEIIEVTDAGTGRVRITQAASQFVQIGSSVTTTGTGGSLQSTAKGDSLTIRNIVANNQFQVVAMIGNWTVV